MTKEDPNEPYYTMRLRKDLPFVNPNKEFYENSNIQSKRKIFHCAKQMKKHVEGKVLDLGCGSGVLTNYFTQNINPEYVLCVDFTDKYQKELKQKGYNIMFFDLDDLPYNIPDESFNTIISTDVVEHLLSPYGYLSECNRILKKGGKLILSTPDCHREVIIVPHLNYFSYKSLKMNLKRAGFTKVKRIYNGVLNPTLTNVTSKIPVLRNILSTGLYVIAEK